MSLGPSKNESSYAKFLDEHTDPVPNEGNMLSLLTMKEFYKPNAQGQGGNQAVVDTIEKIAKEENKYLVRAMDILSMDTSERGGMDQYTLKKRRAAKKMQEKFGKDFKNSVGLASLLKQEADELEFRELMRPHLADVIGERRGADKAGVIFARGQFDNVGAFLADDAFF